MKKTLVTVVSASIVALATPAVVNAIDLRPGKWTFTTTTTLPMLPQPQVSTEDQCVTGNEDPLAEIAPEGCQLLDVEDSSDAMSFKLQCGGTNGMPVMQGEGRFTTNGNSASGEFRFSGAVQGQTFSINVKSEGRYQGETCS